MPHKNLSLLAALAGLLAFAGVSEAARLTRTPYLQSVTPTSALVAFRTDTDCAPRVRFGEGTDTSRISTASTTGRLHVVKLEGLRAGTEHSYAVEACGATTQPVRFTTATPPGSGRVRIAALGDYGTGAPSQISVGRSILSRKPDVFLSLGDGAYDNGTDAEHQKKLFEPLAPLLAEVPIYATPGNHEYLTDKAQPYVDNFYLPANNPAGTERYYSFDWGPAHIVSLDSSCMLALGVAKGRCDQTALRTWLNSDLASTRQPWKIVFFHHPPYSSAAEHGSELRIREMYAPVFEQYGVDLVLTGHDHTYERSYPMKGNTAGASGGVTYLVVGTGSAAKVFVPEQPAWSAVRGKRSIGYLDITIEDGNLTGQMVTPAGAVLDTFRLTKTLPERPEQPVLSAEHSRGSNPLEVLLTAQTTQEGATLLWDFGDGETAEGETVSHVYAEPGSYTVTVTATGGSQELTHSLTVTAEATPGEPTPGEPTPGVPGTQTPPPSGSTPGDPSEAVPDLGLEPSPQAGCSATGAGAWLALAAPLAWVVTRRRRRE